MSAVAPIERTNGNSRIHNTSNKEYKEWFRGKDIVIPANGYIDMEHYMAVEFVGTYRPFVKNERGEILKAKPLKLERLFDPGKIFTTEFKSHADGKTFTSQEELDAHLKANADKFTPQRDEMLDQQLKQSTQVTEVLANLATAVAKIAEKLDHVEKRGKKKDDTK